MLNTIEPQVIWLYGMPAAGKTTLAEKLVADLSIEYPEHVFVLLDGDRLRTYFKLEDLSDYSPDGRRNFQTKLRERARDLCMDGATVVVASISPYLEMRRLNRQCFKNLKYCEIYIACGIATLFERDPKGLYAKARAGELPNMTGITDPFEDYGPDVFPHIIIYTTNETVEESYLNLKKYLKEVADVKI